MNLFGRVKIEDLNPKLCKNAKRKKSRRQLSASEGDWGDGLEGTVAHDPSLPDLLTKDVSNDEHLRRALWKKMVVWCDLFYKRGSICNFCYRDNSDWNSRALLSNSTGND